MTILAGAAYAHIQQENLADRIVEQAYEWLAEIEKK
jgi:hypothetical protein